MISKKTVWLVDDNLRELGIYEERLLNIMPDGAVLRTLNPPYETKEEYIPIIESENTACLIFDQKLKFTGYASYTGIEVALFLRELNPIIPIFILTNYPESISENGWSVEDVLDKHEFSKKIREQNHIMRERLGRRITTYFKAVKQTESRFSELLMKSLDGELSSEEQDELSGLQEFRTKPTLAREFAQLDELEKIARQHRQLEQDFLSTSDNNEAEK